MFLIVIDIKMMRSPVVSMVSRTARHHAIISLVSIVPSTHTFVVEACNGGGVSLYPEGVDIRTIDVVLMVDVSIDVILMVDVCTEGTIISDNISYCVVHVDAF